MGGVDALLGGVVELARDAVALCFDRQALRAPSLALETRYKAGGVGERDNDQHRHQEMGGEALEPRRGAEHRPVDTRGQRDRQVAAGEGGAEHGRPPCRQGRGREDQGSQRERVEGAAPLTRDEDEHENHDRVGDPDRESPACRKPPHRRDRGHRSVGNADHQERCPGGGRLYDEQCRGDDRGGQPRRDEERQPPPGGWARVRHRPRR